MLWRRGRRARLRPDRPRLVPHISSRHGRRAPRKAKAVESIRELRYSTTSKVRPTRMQKLQMTMQITFSHIIIMMINEDLVCVCCTRLQPYAPPGAAIESLRSSIAHSRLRFPTKLHTGRDPSTRPARPGRCVRVDRGALHEFFHDARVEARAVSARHTVHTARPNRNNRPPRRRAQHHVA